MTISRKLIPAAIVLATMIGAGAVQGDELIGGFEGDLGGGRFGTWQLGFDGDLGEEPNAQSGIVGTDFLTDDPGDPDSEGVTEGSQSLEIDLFQWESVYKPYLYLEGGADLAQAIVDGDGLDLDLTPIPPAAGWDPDPATGGSWRQAFLSFTSNTLPFSKGIQIDYTGDLDLDGNPLPQTLSWDFNEVINDDNDPFSFGTYKEFAQAALDADEDAFITLRVILQGRDIDEDGNLIGFNALSPSSVKAAVDNIQLIGVDPPGSTGDFDTDGDVDGTDFLEWQQGFPGTLGASDLVDWQASYGDAGAPAFGSISAVPEPASLSLLVLTMCGVAALRRR